MLVGGPFQVWLQNRSQDANPVVLEWYGMMLRIQFNRIQSHRPAGRLPCTWLEFDDDFFKRRIRDVFFRGRGGFEECDITRFPFKVSNLTSCVRHLLVQIRQIYGNRWGPGVTFGLLMRRLCNSYDSDPGIIDLHLFSSLNNVRDTKQQNNNSVPHGMMHAHIQNARLPKLGVRPRLISAIQS
jgi:hypothetical protein